MRLTNIFDLPGQWWRRASWKPGYAVRYCPPQPELISTRGDVYYLRSIDYLATDWEPVAVEQTAGAEDPFDLYAPTPTEEVHDIAWAIKMAREGIPIRRREWARPLNIYCRTDGELWTYWNDSIIARWRPEQEDLWATDWEVEKR